MKPTMRFLLVFAGAALFGLAIRSSRGQTLALSTFWHARSASHSS
jgi:hypothetical protein